MEEESHSSGAFVLDRGAYMGYFYKINKNELTIYEDKESIDVETSSFKILFDVTARIEDCIYFCLNETSPGLLVAIHNPFSTLDEIKYISLVKKKVYKSLFVPGRITRLVNIIDGAKRSEIRNLPDYQSWPHLIGAVINNTVIMGHLNIADEKFQEAISKDLFNDRTNVFNVSDICDTSEQELALENRFEIGKLMYIHESYTIAFDSQENECAFLNFINLKSGEKTRQNHGKLVVEKIYYQVQEKNLKKNIYFWAVFSKDKQLRASLGKASPLENNEYSNFTFCYYLKLDDSKFEKFISCTNFGEENSVYHPANFYSFTWQNIENQIITTLFDLANFRKERRRSTLESKCINDDKYFQRFLKFQKTGESYPHDIFDVLVVQNACTTVSAENIKLKCMHAYSTSFKMLGNSSQMIKVDIKSEVNEYLKIVAEDFPQFLSNPNKTCVELANYELITETNKNDNMKFYIFSSLYYNNFKKCICAYISISTIDDLNIMLFWINEVIKKCQEKSKELEQALKFKNDICKRLPKRIGFADNLVQIKVIPNRYQITDMLKTASTISPDIPAVVHPSLPSEIADTTKTVHPLQLEIPAPATTTASQQPSSFRKRSGNYLKLKLRNAQRIIKNKNGEINNLRDQVARLQTTIADAKKLAIAYFQKQQQIKEKEAAIQDAISECSNIPTTLTVPTVPEVIKNNKRSYNNKHHILEYDNLLLRNRVEQYEKQNITLIERCHALLNQLQRVKKNATPADSSASNHRKRPSQTHISGSNKRSRNESNYKSGQRENATKINASNHLLSFSDNNPTFDFDNDFEFLSCPDEIRHENRVEEEKDATPEKALENISLDKTLAAVKALSAVARQNSENNNNSGKVIEIILNSSTEDSDSAINDTENPHRVKLRPLREAVRRRKEKEQRQRREKEEQRQRREEMRRPRGLPNNTKFPKQSRTHPPQLPQNTSGRPQNNKVKKPSKNTKSQQSGYVNIEVRDSEIEDEARMQEEMKRKIQLGECSSKKKGRQAVHTDPVVIKKRIHMRKLREQQKLLQPPIICTRKAQTFVHIFVKRSVD